MNFNKLWASLESLNCCHHCELHALTASWPSVSAQPVPPDTLCIFPLCGSLRRFRLTDVSKLQDALALFALLAYRIAVSISREPAGLACLKNLLVRTTAGRTAATVKKLVSRFLCTQKSVLVQILIGRKFQAVRKVCCTSLNAALRLVNQKNNLATC